jgi:arsenite/tail-anchored protein-transporting ATPase
VPVRVASSSEMPLWGMEIELQQARQELRDLMAGGGADEFNSFLDNLGLGVVSEQLKDLNLGELLDTPPPGVDEAVAISKVCMASP